MQAYGIVWRAVNKKNGATVALKKIFDAFRNQIDAQVVLSHFINHCEISVHLEK